MNASDLSACDAPVLLVHHLPQRDGPLLRQVVPAAVKAPDQLPPYLILGARDDASFRCDRDGWSIRWKGLEPKTELRWQYQRSTDTNTVSQRWRGIRGGTAKAAADVRIEEVIGRIYDPFPKAWDAEARNLYSGTFSVAYIGEVGPDFKMVFLPDGVFRIIVLPMCVDRARGFAADWVHRVRSASPAFPVSTYLMRLQCLTAYVHGHHGISGDDPDWLLQRCERQTGLRPEAPVARVNVQGDQPAWQIARRLLCAVTAVPFAGLTSTLRMLDDAGMLIGSKERYTLRDDQPDGAVPLVLPMSYGPRMQLTLWTRDQGVQLRWLLPDLGRILYSADPQPLVQH